MYRVGELNGQDVYWEEREGFAVEEDNTYPVNIVDLRHVKWFGHDEDREELEAAILEGRVTVLDARLLIAYVREVRKHASAQNT